MNKEEFKKFKEEWKEENSGLNIIHYRNVNKDVVDDILRIAEERTFEILEKYNEKIKEKEND